MTERENYLKLIHGEQPDWIPCYREACEWVVPAITTSYMATEEKIDFLGVHWVINEAGPMADTTYYVMDDVTRWREYVNLPDIDAFDWEHIAPQELASIDREKKAVACMPGLGGGCFFIPLMNMMGFEEGLCAMVDEEEAVLELFEHFCQWYEKLIPYLVKYYHPDVIIMGDDICAAQGPFISYSIYEKLLRPFYQRCFSLIQSYGVKIELHMCGKCESFLDDMVALGVSIWEPAQPLNDLKAIKAKHGNRLVFNGTWMTSGPGGVPGASESIVRKSVRDCMDAYGEGGGLCFWDGDPVGSSPETLQKFAWLREEAISYGKTFYQK